MDALATQEKPIEAVEVTKPLKKDVSYYKRLIPVLVILSIVAGGVLLYSLSKVYVDIMQKGYDNAVMEVVYKLEQYGEIKVPITLQDGTVYDYYIQKGENAIPTTSDITTTTVN
jgi:hypothetical protein